MRNTLLTIVLLLVGMIYVVADFLGGRSPGFPDAAQFSRLISIREPQNFTDLVAESIGGGELGGGDLRGVWAALDEASRGAGPSDQSSIEAIRGTILGNYGHPDRAIPMLSRALKGSQNLDERADILAQLYGACRNTGYYETFRIAVENKDLKAAFPAQIADYLKKLTGAQAGIDQKRRLKMLLAWLVLLLLPWFVSEIRCRRWLKRFPTEQERPGPYFAFVRSVIGTILCLFSSVMVLFWNLPAALGYSHSLVLAFLHLLAAGLFSLYPFYHLDREVRQTSWSFFAYFAVFIRMSLLNSIVLIIPLLALLILREMTAALPLWPVTWPLGVGLGFPALCGAMLLILPVFIPTLLGLWRQNPQQMPLWAKDLKVPVYKWNLTGGKIFNALSFGYFSPTQGIAVTTPLADEFSAELVAAIVAHERGHLEKGHLFVYFLLLFAGTMLGGLYAVVWPIEVQRCLTIGPGPWQALGFFVVFLSVMKIFRKIAWVYECEADSFAAAIVGREEYIRALSDLTVANFLPVRVREGEELLGIHPPLQERKRRLRCLAGECLESGHAPSFPTLIALWRSRLALDWKGGQQDAVHLCTLDYHLEASARVSRWRELAAKHVEFGAEVLLLSGGKGLEILSCAQKACARKADPILPADRICLLCSAGMKDALAETPPPTWQGTATGCRISSVGL